MTELDKPKAEAREIMVQAIFWALVAAVGAYALVLGRWLLVDFTVPHWRRDRRGANQNPTRSTSVELVRPWPYEGQGAKRTSKFDEILDAADEQMDATLNRFLAELKAAGPPKDNEERKQLAARFAEFQRRFSEKGLQLLDVINRERDETGSPN